MPTVKSKSGKRLLLYDGVCALCNGLVRFVIRRDTRERYIFAAIQSDVARELLTKHGRDPDELNTLYLVHNYGTPEESLSTRGRGALRVLRGLGGAWRVFVAFEILPGFLLNGVYRLVARNRYRTFGKLDACPAPAPEHRGKFLG